MVDYPSPSDRGGIDRARNGFPGKILDRNHPDMCSRFYSRKKERNDSEAGDFFGEEVRSRKKEGEDGEKDWGSGRE